MKMNLILETPGREHKQIFFHGELDEEGEMEATAESYDNRVTCYICKRKAKLLKDHLERVFDL